MGKKSKKNKSGNVTIVKKSLIHYFIEEVYADVDEPPVTFFINKTSQCMWVCDLNKNKDMPKTPQDSKLLFRFVNDIINNFKHHRNIFCFFYF